MKKKIVSVLMVMLIMIGVPVAAEESKEAELLSDGVFSYYINEGKAVISECSETEKSVIEIPRRLGGKPVGAIDGGAFSGCTALKSFVTDNGNFYVMGGVLYQDDVLVCYPPAREDESFDVPRDITRIANCAFFGSKYLEQVFLPDGLEEIGTEAFAGCQLLERVHGGGNVVKIGGGAFAFCSALSDFSIPDTVKEIGDAAFYECKSLKEISLNDDIIYIGKLAFCNCPEITEIHIPDGVAEVSQWLFSVGDGLEKITVSDKNKNFTVEDGILFSKDMKKLIYCPPSMKSGDYKLPDETEEIGEGAFEENKGISGFDAGKSLKKIDARAFYNADNLKKLNIGGADEIGEYAFFGCDKLGDVTVRADVTSVGEGAFGECEGLMLHIASGSAAYFYALQSNVPYTFDPMQDEVPIPHWAEEYRQWGIEKGIVAPGTDFDAPLTYEGFCWMIANMYEEVCGKVEVPENNPFYDTKSSGVLKAYALGFVHPMWENRFGPERITQRQEICVYLHHFLSKVNEEEPERGEAQTFRDSADLAEWAVGYVDAAYNNGIISGLPDGRINPKGHATIDQTLAMLYNASGLISR